MTVIIVLYLFYLLFNELKSNVHIFFELILTPPCEVGLPERNSDWHKLSQVASWLAEDLNGRLDNLTF